MSYISLHQSKPKEILAEKKRMPVVYLGLGILEWHGLHNPAGLDGIKAEGMAIHFAKKFGGTVAPTQFWGDFRGDICELVFKPDLISAAEFDHTPMISQELGYDQNELERNARRDEEKGGWRLWIDLVVHTFFQLESFGYQCIVPIPGHYPLFNPLDQAIEQYEKDGGTCSIAVIKDPLFDESGHAGDHAAKFETSLMLHLYPELVDMSRLSSDLSQANIGVMGEDPRLYASKEFGELIMNKLDLVLETYLRNLGFLTTE